MAAGTRLVDHPTLTASYLVQHVADMEGEKVVVAQVIVARSLGIGEAIKEGEAIIGEWLMGATPIPSLEPWLANVRADLQAHLANLKQKRELQEAARLALEKENARLP